MHLPPGPGRCRQRAAADAARFPESFPRPAGTPKDRSRPGPPPGASVSGPGHSAFRPRHLRRMVRRLAVQAAPADRTFRPPPQTGGSIPFRPHIPPRTDRRFRSIQTGHSASRKLNTPPAVGRRCSARQATLYAGAGTKKPGRQSTLYAEAGTKKTGRQPTLGPARGTGYRDASSCRRPAICGKISAQITRRTGTARQPGQPVVQI